MPVIGLRPTRRGVVFVGVVVSLLPAMLVLVALEVTLDVASLVAAKLENRDDATTDVLELVIKELSAAGDDPERVPLDNDDAVDARVDEATTLSDVSTASVTALMPTASPTITPMRSSVTIAARTHVRRRDVRVVAGSSQSNDDSGSLGVSRILCVASVASSSWEYWAGGTV